MKEPVGHVQYFEIKPFTTVSKRLARESPIDDSTYVFEVSLERHLPLPQTYQELDLSVSGSGNIKLTLVGFESVLSSSLPISHLIPLTRVWVKYKFIG